MHLLDGHKVCVCVCGQVAEVGGFFFLSYNKRPYWWGAGPAHDFLRRDVFLHFLMQKDKMYSQQFLGFTHNGCN